MLGSRIRVPPAFRKELADEAAVTRELSEMSWTRFCAGASLCISLSGCGLLFGEAVLPVVEMHRVSDGAKVSCFSGVYAAGIAALLLGSKANAQRIVNACILACRKRGFVEDGEPTQIEEASSVLKQEEGWGNTPPICKG